MLVIKLNANMKKMFLLLPLLFPLLIFAQQGKIIYREISNTTVYDVPAKKVFMFTAGMAIDADGAPKAYNKNNSIALDFLSNGGVPGNWWALVTDKNGSPIVQTAKDPAPGYYISMTTLEDDSKRMNDPNRYVNAAAIPYIVITSKFSNDFKMGDIALVINKKNNKHCFAIAADVGAKLGEGSVYLAQQLGLGADSNPKHGGVETGIIYILIKNSGSKKILNNEKITEIGQSLLKEEDIAELLK